MLTRRRCCCGGALCFGCLPCFIPARNLDFAWSGGTGGSGTGTAVTSEITGPFGYPGRIWQATLGDGTIITLTCVFTGTSTAGGWSFSVTRNAGVDSCVSTAGEVSQVEYICEPFYLKIRLSTVDCPTIVAAGYLDFTFTDPGGPVSGCECAPLIPVLGCNGLPLPFATVTVKDLGGTTLESGTANSIGQYAVSGTGATRTLVLGKSPYFADTTFTPRDVSCNAPFGSFGPPNPASGYRCGAWCADSIPNVLNVTWTGDAGAQTLTWNSGAGAWLSSWNTNGVDYAMVLRTDGTWSLSADGNACRDDDDSSINVTCDPLIITFTAEGDCAVDLGEGTATE